MSRRRDRPAAPLRCNGEYDDLEGLLAEIRACRHCMNAPDATPDTRPDNRRAGIRPLPHEPRPVVRASRTARIAVCGQAPGTRVHASGVPFSDPSGERLRAWMGVSAEEFYDDRRIAIVPMGFCFPGHDAAGADLPPRPECARLWRARIFEHLAEVRLILLVGMYAMRWHLDDRPDPRMTPTVLDWRRWRIAPEAATARAPSYVPLPHPSWRNNAWLKRNPWFETELLPHLRGDVRAMLGP